MSLPRRRRLPAASVVRRHTPLAARRTVRTIEQHWTARLRLIQQIKALPYDDPTDVFPRALRIVTEFLGMDAGVISVLEGDVYRVRSAYTASGDDLTGRCMPLDDTYCVHTIRRNDVLALPDVDASPLATCTAHALLGYRAYLGAPVRLDERVTGTLCFVGQHPHPPFSPADIEMVRLLAHWVSTRVRNERDLTDLRHSEERFRVLATATFEAVVLSEHGVVLDANANAVALFAYPNAETFAGVSVLDLVHPGDLALVQQMTRTQQEATYEARLRRYDGSVFLAEIQGRPIPYEGRTVRVAAVRDITAERAQEDRIRFQADVLAQVHDAVIATDRTGRVVFWNDGARRLTGLAADKVLSQKLHRTVRYEWATTEAADDARHTLRMTGKWHGEVFVHTRFGPRCAELTTTRRGDEAFEGLIVVARDVTERYATQQELLRQARQDALTGQLNRAAFAQRLAERHAHFRTGGDPYAVVFLDLDGFKQVNDTHGHAVGDALLAEVGRRLQRIVRRSDAVARLGGDEFAVLLDQPGGEEGLEQAQRRILRTLTLPLELETVTLEPAASLGAALATAAHADADAVTRDADTAMYENKRKRRGPMAFRPTVTPPPVPDLAGLPEGEMVLYAQPIVSLADATIAGFEILVRWQHPTHGLLGPGTFLPALLATDAMPAFDFDVLGKAAAWAATLPEDVRVFVNLSRRGLLHDELPERLRDLLDETGLTPARLVVELTEQIHETPEDLRAAERLRETGVGLCLDDFGAGHASVSLAEALPLDLLKVDRRLVSRLGANTPIEQMLEGLIGMTHARGIPVVAEGVETPHHLARARGIGFDRAQGFLFSFPVPLAAAAEMLHDPLPWSYLWHAPA